MKQVFKGLCRSYHRSASTNEIAPIFSIINKSIIKNENSSSPSSIYNFSLRSFNNNVAKKNQELAKGEELNKEVDDDKVISNLKEGFETNASDSKKKKQKIRRKASTYYHAPEHATNEFFEDETEVSNEDFFRGMTVDMKELFDSEEPMEDVSPFFRVPVPDYVTRVVQNSQFHLLIEGCLSMDPLLEFKEKYKLESPSYFKEIEKYEVDGKYDRLILDEEFAKNSIIEFWKRTGKSREEMLQMVENGTAQKIAEEIVNRRQRIEDRFSNDPEHRHVDKNVYVRKEYVKNYSDYPSRIHRRGMFREAFNASNRVIPIIERNYEFSNPHLDVKPYVTRLLSQYQMGIWNQNLEDEAFQVLDRLDAMLYWARKKVKQSNPEISKYVYEIEKYHFRQQFEIAKTLIEMYFYQGRWEEIDDLASKIASRFPDDSFPFEPLVLLYKSFIHADKGELEQTRDLIQNKIKQSIVEQTKKYPFLREQRRLFDKNIFLMEYFAKLKEGTVKDLSYCADMIYYYIRYFEDVEEEEEEVEDQFNHYGVFKDAGGYPDDASLIAGRFEKDTIFIQPLAVSVSQLMYKVDPFEAYKFINFAILLNNTNDLLSPGLPALYMKRLKMWNEKNKEIPQDEYIKYFEQSIQYLKLSKGDRAPELKYVYDTFVKIFENDKNAKTKYAVDIAQYKNLSKELSEFNGLKEYFHASPYECIFDKFEYKNPTISRADQFQLIEQMKKESREMLLSMSFDKKTKEENEDRD